MKLLIILAAATAPLQGWEDPSVRSARSRQLASAGTARFRAAGLRPADADAAGAGVSNSSEH